MAIDSAKFQFKGKRLPYRDRATFEDWKAKMSEKGKLGSHGLVPYRNPLTPNSRFDPKLVNFPSVREFIEYARAIPGMANADTLQTEYNRRRGESVSLGQEDVLLTRYRRGNRDWDWGFNLNDTFALYDRGWTEGIEAVNDRIEATASAAMMAAMKEVAPVRDLHGAFIDIDAYIQGNPECMFEFQDVVTPQLHLIIEIDSLVEYCVSAEEILMRGIAISSAIMALRRVGVFVTAYRSEKSRPTASWLNESVTEVNIQIMNQDLTENLSETLFALCHPAFYRNIFFHGYSALFATDQSGVCSLARRANDYIPKSGSGKVVIPCQFWSAPNADEALDDLGIDWHNSWASPKAAEDLVKLLFQCAAPR